MVIGIDEYSDVPIYQQIRNQIVMGISDGRLQAGEQLPTVRALAHDMGINTMTVSKAYQILKAEGYISTDRKNSPENKNKYLLNTLYKKRACRKSINSTIIFIV